MQRNIKLFLVTTTEQKSNEYLVGLKDYNDITFAGFCFTSNNSNYEELVKACDPDVILVEHGTSDMDAFEVRKLNEAKFPSVDTVLIMQDKDFDLLQRAYQAGFPLVVTFPVDWKGVVERIREMVEKRRSALLPAQPLAHKPFRGSENRGVTLSFISAKDGEGKTTIALNLAACLAAKFKKRVILFDLSSALSETAMMLNRKAPGSYMNLLRMTVSEFEFQTVRNLMIDYLNNGRFLALCGPTTLRMPEVKYFEIDLLIRLLQKNCEYLLIDAPVVFTDSLKAALNLSDWHVMITQNHIGSLRNMKLYLAELLKLDYPAHLVRVVLNRVSSSVGLSPADMHRFIDPYPVVAGISSDGPTVLTALNEGTPFMLTSQGTDIANCIDNLAQQIMGTIQTGTRHFDIHAALSDYMESS